MVLLGSDRVQPIVGKCLSDSPGSRTQAESFQEGANQAQFALWSFTLSKIELLKAHLRDGVTFLSLIESKVFTYQLVYLIHYLLVVINQPSIRIAISSQVHFRVPVALA